MRYLSCLLAAAFVVAAPSLAAAQGPAFELAPGERIEIDAPGLDSLLVPATVTRWGRSWVGFSLEDGQEWTRHLHRIDRVRVRREVPLKGRLRSGLAWGLFLGTSLGGMASPFLARAAEGESDPWAAVGAGAALGAVTGAATGALIGALLPRSTWTLYLLQPSGARPGRPR